jgi:hypothetical protein
MSSLQERLDLVSSKVLEGGKTLYGWAGMDNEEPIQKINYVFFYCLVPIAGRVVARKVAGTRSLLCGGMKLVFSTNLLRSRDKLTGLRRVVLPKDLHVTETAYPTGQAKELREGARPYEFSMSRPADVGTLALLERLAFSEAIVTERVVCPMFYLGAHSPEDFQPVRAGKIVEILKASANYQELGSIADNFTRCFDSCFSRSVDDRYLIEYDLVTGCGVPYVDLGTARPVYKLVGDPLAINVSTETFVLDVESSIRKVISWGQPKDIVHEQDPVELV